MLTVNGDFEELGQRCCPVEVGSEVIRITNLKACGSKLAR